MTISENKSDATTGQPSVVSIVVMYALAFGAAGAMLWTMTGEVFDGRHLVGALTGFLLSIALFVQAGSRVGRRIEARRARRRLEAETRKYVGRWLDPDTGQTRLTMRYVPHTGAYLGVGEIAAGWRTDACGFPFADASVAFVALVEAERDGMVPARDEGTRLIRARLRLPGWDEADVKPSAYTPV